MSCLSSPKIPMILHTGGISHWLVIAIVIYLWLCLQSLHFSLLLRISCVCIMKYDHVYRWFLTSTHPPPNFILSPFLSFLETSSSFLFHLVRLVLSIWTRSWGHPLEPVDLVSSHVLKKEWFSFFPKLSAAGSTAEQGRTWRSPAHLCQSSGSLDLAQAVRR